MATTSSSHYALVSSSTVPLVLLPTEADPQKEQQQQPPTNETPFPNSLDRPKTTKILFSEVTAVFRNYAEWYPNPKLIEEVRARDTLLQATSAAASARIHAVSKPNQQQQGFFSYLFGSKSNTTITQRQQQQQERSNTNNDHDLLLHYLEQEEDEEDGNKEGLCGTTKSLDTTCIPDEAYSVARFHLTSTRTRREQPNVVRVAEMLSSSSDNRMPPLVTMVVIGLGRIAEFFPDGSSHIMTTSDQEELLDFAGGDDHAITTSATEATTASSTTTFRLERARAVAIGPNCIAVSWGFSDGLIIVYRRMHGFQDGVGWEHVWMIQPSRAVLENMTGASSELFVEELMTDGGESPGSPLLTVSDIIPLMVETPQPSTNTEPSEGPTHAPPLVATLAVARLGGYLELIPLPTGLWYAPILTPDNHQRPKPKKNRKSSKRQRTGQKENVRGKHYANGKRMGQIDQTIALTTSDYHMDIMCLDAFRTQVSGDTEWNTVAFPEAPPAEYILAASGTSKQHGQETISFWGVSTLFPEATEEQNSIGFHLHAMLLEAIIAPSGAHVSIFATPDIMNRWRKPRRVQLRENAILPENSNTSENNNNNNNEPAIPSQTITTIATPTPNVSMRFSKTNGSSTGATAGPFLAILDWNGSATIFDCSFLDRVASQRMSQQEYDLYRNANASLGFAATVVSRSQFANGVQQSFKGKGMPRQPIQVSNIHWLSNETTSTPEKLPPLVVVSKRPRTLKIVTYSWPERTQQGNAFKAPKFATTSLPFPGHGAAIASLGSGDLSFVSLHRNRKTHLLCLKSFVMQRLDPRAIIQSLAQASKFKEAIQAVKILPQNDQLELSTVVKDCHKQLWETAYEMESLEATNDAEYVVQEALKLCRLDNMVEGVTLETICSACTLALDLSKNEVSTANEEQREELHGFLITLGSYQLLCRHFSSEVSFSRFREDFLRVSIKELAIQFAKTADMQPLSLLFVRHRRDLVPDALEILGVIPLSVNPQSFCHLLPMVRHGQISDCFLASIDKDDTSMHWSHMPHHLSETCGVTVVLNPKDEKMVLDFNQKLSTKEVDKQDLSSSVTAEWFVSRAVKMQRFLGNLQPVILICQAGLQCSSSNPNASSEPALQKLHTIWRSSSSLRDMLIEGVVPIDEGGEASSSQSAMISTNDLFEMDLTDIVALVLHGITDREEISSRCSKYLYPLLMGVRHLAAKSIDYESELDKAVSSYCLGMIKGYSDIEIQTENDEADLISYIHSALAGCAAIAAISATSISKQDRLIKNKMILIDLVLSVVQEVATAFERSTISSGDVRPMVNFIWDMYEALPAHIPFSIENAESWRPVMESLNDLHKDLVGVDIVSRWPFCRPFGFFVAMRKSRKDDQSQSRDPSHVVETGIKTVEELCRSFLSQIHLKDDDTKSGSQESRSMLQDLLCDIEEFSRHCLNDSDQVSSTLCVNLVRPLLTQERFHLITVLLSNAKAFILDRDQALGGILAYVNEAVFADSASSTKTLAAIHCIDILGPACPDLQAGFLSVRRYLDAADFINRIIYEGNIDKAVKPSDLRRRSPLDVVECILADAPRSVICGCEKWTDERFAVDANRRLRRHHAQQSNRTGALPRNEEMPTLPGGAIFHLATILGLDDDMSALAVKCRVSHYSMSAGLHGAAAAICWTLVSVDTFAQNDAVSYAKLSAVAEVVSSSSYTDIITQKALCTAVLQKFSGSVSLNNKRAFDAIVAASVALEQRTSRYSREIRDSDTEEIPRPNGRPVSRLYEHIRAEYNADIHGLFSDLLEQTSRCVVHDALMNALARFITYWCLSDATRLRRRLDGAEKADASEVLAMASSMILHIPSLQTATICVDELKKIVEDQVGKVANEERFSTKSDIIVPDQSIVRSLVGRGYSENGARRATVMTQNSGLDAALAWAISHSHGRDFNSPIVVVKRGRDNRCIDEDGIQLLCKILFLVEGILKQPGSIKSFLRSIATMRDDDAWKVNRRESKVAAPMPESADGDDLETEADSALSIASVEEVEAVSNTAATPQRSGSKSKFGIHDEESTSEALTMITAPSMPTTKERLNGKDLRPLPPPILQGKTSPVGSSGSSTKGNCCIIGATGRDISGKSAVPRGRQESKLQSGRRDEASKEVGTAHKPETKSARLVPQAEQKDEASKAVGTVSKPQTKSARQVPQAEQKEETDGAFNSCHTARMEVSSNGFQQSQTKSGAPAAPAKTSVLRKDINKISGSTNETHIVPPASIVVPNIPSPTRHSPEADTIKHEGLSPAPKPLGISPLITNGGISPQASHPKGQNFQGRSTAAFPDESQRKEPNQVAAPKPNSNIASQQGEHNHKSIQKPKPAPPPPIAVKKPINRSTKNKASDCNRIPPSITANESQATTASAEDSVLTNKARETLRTNTIVSDRTATVTQSLRPNQPTSQSSAPKVSPLTDTSVSSSSPARTSLSPLLDRAKLRERGKESLTLLRGNKGTSTAADERRRLIEEGRRLLKLQRATHPSPRATRTPTASTPVGSSISTPTNAMYHSSPLLSPRVAEERRSVERESHGGPTGTRTNGVGHPNHAMHPNGNGFFADVDEGENPDTTVVEQQEDDWDFKDDFDV